MSRDTANSKHRVKRFDLVKGHRASGRKVFISKVKGMCGKVMSITQA